MSKWKAYLPWVMIAFISAGVYNIADAIHEHRIGEDSFALGAFFFACVYFMHNIWRDRMPTWKKD